MKHARFNSDPNWPQSHCSHMRTNEKETRLTTSARGSYRLSSLAYRPKKLESESEVAQSCATLCHPVDCSPPGSSLQGLLQARNWSGLAFPSPGDLPNPGIKPGSPTLQAHALTSDSPGIETYP